MKHELPTLPYGYDALEPYIDAQTMEIHHTKHHQGYVDKLNKAIEGTGDLQDMSPRELLANLNTINDENVRTAVRNNGGGHANHSLFWKILAPHGEGGGEPKGDFASALEKEFGSFNSFKEEFTSTATGVFGSGWAWLALTPEGKLHLHGLPNQDSPFMHGDTPVMGIDVWEHAYYLKYQNMRGSYVDAFWNIVNWEQVSKNFTEATS